MIKSKYKPLASITDKLKAKMLDNVRGCNDELPFTLRKDPPQNIFIEKFAARCVSLSKKAAIAREDEYRKELEAEIESILHLVWNNGNDNGLRIMDKMHKEV